MAVTPSYVALGDSYAAGVGAGDRRDACWRAEAGYPVEVARGLGVDVAYQACLGAMIEDVRAHQLDVLAADTQIVTLTIGGNDLGFVPVLVSAAEPAWLTDSDARIDAALRTLRTTLPGRLDDLYREVRARAPKADVVVAGYPRLFAGEDCSLLTFFTTHEMRRLDAAADELSGVIAAASERAGFGYVDVRATFTGHAICQDGSWVHDVTWPLEASFHPRREGHAAYAEQVLGALGGRRDTARQPVVARGAAERGSAPTFSLPDLMSGRARRAAADWGLDPDEVALLSQRVASPAGDRAAAEELQALDRKVAERRWG